MSNSGDTLKIGEILVREGYLTMDGLNKALKQQQEQNYLSKQKKAYKPFGQICVELNLISSEELQRTLRKHNKQIRLGELLLNQGLIQDKHIEWALEQQKKIKLRFGEILLQGKILNQNQLLDALSIQLDIPRILPSLDLIDEKLLEQMPLDYFTNNLCIPMYQSGRELTVVMAYPDNENLIKEFENNYRCRVSPAIASPSAILETLKEFEKLSTLPSLEPLSAIHLAQDIPSQTPKKVEAIKVQEHISVGGSPLETSDEQRKQEDQVVNFLLKNAMTDRASGIHIEPQEKHIRIRYRIDGVLHHKTDLPTHLGPAMLKRMKELCHLNPAEQKIHQRGRVEGSFNDRQLELNVSTYPSLWGENMVLGVQEKESTVQERLLNIERIGFSPLYLQRFQNVLNEPGGLIILTGPAHSGKTTTLYASINYLNQQNRSIITAENPIEMAVPGTIQGGFNPETGQSFADMIQSMMHLDPDVLMISEINNQNTLQSVVEVALTGAKVMTTYPAFDATGALLRMNRMGLEQYLLAASNITVLSQRLVRRLCPQCKQVHIPPQKTFNQLGLVDVTPESYTYFKPVGCEACAQRGYVDQIAIHEFLQINEAIREAILDNKPAATIRGIARTEAKLVSMAEDGLFKALEGLTSVEEVQRVAFVNEYDAQTPWEAEEIYNICKGLQEEFI